MSDLATLVATARAEFAACTDAAALENAKARYLGKAGALTEMLKGLGKLSAAERPAAGAAINVAKQQLEDALTAQRAALADAKLAEKLAADALDVSLPGRGRGVGALHPLTRVQERVETLFHSMGFAVADGPEIEDDFHNFTALNTPENHPARSMQDTFYVESGMVLRTHTSPIQVRYMETHAPPIKIIAPGRVYRVDSDATHSPMFHQVEGLWIDRDVTFADLKGTLVEFLRRFFERDDLAGALPAVVLPVHRAVGRGRHGVRRRRLARDRGLGPGSSQRAARGEHRSGGVPGLRVRHGSRPARDAALWHRRPAPVLRE